MHVIFCSEIICDLMLQVSFSIVCSFLKVSTKTKKDYPCIWALCSTKHVSRRETEHKFTSLNACRLVFMPYIADEGAPLSFCGENRQSGRRGRYGVVVQKEHSKAQEGWKGAFLLQVVTCGKAMGETSVDLVRILPRLSLHVPFDTDPYTDIS